RDVIHRVVNICGRLRVSPTTGFRSFASRTKSSPAFAQSVKLFEKREGDLQAADKKRMMTVRAMFGDELVPSDTATVDGAYNIAIPTTEHVLTIAAALTVFSKPIIKFLI
ncbi:MAG: hypothetical protein NTY06_03950, partial [Candidatus Gottesmanbacteria bacterium]|nr:hypothetical protein [Candidatus Gottesmanbacteria bacterium]